MTIKITTAAIALIANAACVFCPSSTAPRIASGPHFCAAVSRHGHCAAPATCACIAFEENSAVVVSEAGYAVLPAHDSEAACTRDELSYGPAAPVNPPHEACKPSVLRYLKRK
jgi:hypothetical protein